MNRVIIFLPFRTNTPPKLHLVHLLSSSQCLEKQNALILAMAFFCTIFSPQAPMGHAKLLALILLDISMAMGYAYLKSVPRGPALALGGSGNKVNEGKGSTNM